MFWLSWLATDESFIIMVLYTEYEPKKGQIIAMSEFFMLLK
jgi:hypothetical protein